jgi:hypothetical protein
MMELLTDIDGFLLEPLDSSKEHKVFLRNLAAKYPDDVMILNQMKGEGNKVAFQWIKIKVSTDGLRAIVDAVDHFQDFLAFYTLRHQTIATLPEKVKSLLSIRDSVSETELLAKIQDVMQDGKED